MQTKPQSPVGVVLVAAALVGACGGARSRPAQPAPELVSPLASSALQAGTPCALAAAQRARVPELLEQGRLDRTVRVLEHAAQLCPEQAPQTWAIRVVTLAELGRVEEGRALADEIERSPRVAAEIQRAAQEARRLLAEASKRTASAAQRARAGEAYRQGAALTAEGKHEAAARRYLEAWELAGDDGEALIRAGEALFALDRQAEAQRLFDRGLVALERSTGAPVRAAAPRLIGSTTLAVTRTWPWLLAVAHDRYVSLVDGVTGLERRRLDHGPSAEALDRVRAATFSPDGSLLVSGAADATVRIWDVATGRELRRLAGLEKPALGVALSPDGKTVAAGSFDGSLWVWEGKQGRPLLRNELTEIDQRMESVAFTADGRQLVSANYDGTVRLWDVATGRAMQEIPADGDTVESTLAATPDGTKIASPVGNEVVIRDARDGRVLRRLQHDHRVRGVAFSPSGNAVAAGSIQNTVRVWDVETGRTLREVSSPLCIHGVHFAPDGATVAWHTDHDIFLWDVAVSGAVRRIDRRSDSVQSLAFGPSGFTLAAARRALWLWRAEPGRELTHLGDPERDPITEIAFAPDGQTVASGTRDSTLQLWDVATGRKRPLPHEDVGSVSSLAFSPDGERLAANAGSRTTLLTRESWRPQWHRDSAEYLAAVAFAKDSTLALAMEKNGIYFLDPTSAAEVRTLEDPRGFSALAFSPRGDRLATGSWRGHVRIWEYPSGRLLHALQEPTEPELHETFVAFSPSGEFLAASAADDEARVWEVESGRLVLDVAEPRSGPVAFSADGRWLAAVSGGRITIRSVPDGAAVLELHTAADEAAGFVITPDGYVDLFGATADLHPVCRVGEIGLPFCACAERFRVDGLLGAVLSEDARYRTP